MTTTSEATTKDTQQLLIANLNIVANAIQNKTKVGRGASNKLNLYGIKKIRQLILDLAVRGLLVPQDNSDEPASVLLEKIATEKSELIKQGKIKKQKPLPAISEDEKPFAIPDSWQWVRLDNFFDVRDGTHDTPKYENNGYPLITSKNISSGYLDFSNVKYISKQDHLKISERSKVDKEDILFAMIGSIGNPIIVNTNSEFSIKNVALFKYYNLKLSNPKYLLYYLKATEASFKKESTGAVQSFVSLKKLRSYLFVLPPLAEQQRIVAKVDELMALCDQLEQQQQDSITTHNTLVTTLLNALTNANNKQEFNNTWTTITDNFALLFTTEQSIDELKQCILQLAVMGKLVQQDASDEPASVLLEKIATEKAELIKQGKIKKQKPLPAISEAEKPFAIPDSWEWVRIATISTLKGGFAYKSNEFIKQGMHQVIRLGNIRPNNLRLNVSPVFITTAQAKETSQYKIIGGDIVLTMTGTKGKRDYLYSLAVNQNEISTKNIYLNQRLCVLRFFIMKGGFINIAIKNDILLDKLYSKSTGTANQANVGMEAISNWTILLPPLAEQQRIVAKVDELMAICDNLKQALAETQQLQLNLADATVEHIF